ncbi:MAG: hypothetical protein ACRDOY_06850 [Nocardioidaceae bacterium]
MTAARHRGGHTRQQRWSPDATWSPRSPWRTLRLLAALLVVGGSFAAGLALAEADDASPTEFTAVVTRFADDGALMCVRQREPNAARPFCDLYYTPPGTQQISVGDQVMVHTISSVGADGAPVSGMLVSPLP